jgi:uncharacterized LabA/DUF88 family protein
VRTEVTSFAESTSEELLAAADSFVDMSERPDTFLL